MLRYFWQILAATEEVVIFHSLLNLFCLPLEHINILTVKIIIKAMTLIRCTSDETCLLGMIQIKV